MEGLYAGFQGDDSDAVTIETVATIYCPSPLDRKERGRGCGLMEKETRRVGFKSRWGLKKKNILRWIPEDFNGIHNKNSNLQRK